MLVDQDHVSVLDPVTSRIMHYILHPLRVFIGKDPLGNVNLDGNSILVETDTREYTYIGHRVYSFSTDSDIVEYISEVGNSDVPYPYAIDSDGKYYLMLEDVIVNSVPNEQWNDPYEYLYAIRGKDVGDRVGVHAFEASGEYYDFSYQRYPLEHYAYPWMEGLHAVYYSGWHDVGAAARARGDGRGLREDTYPISKDEYVEIMKDIEGIFGLTPLRTIEILSREIM